MDRIKKAFLVIHVLLWTMLSLLVAFQLKSEGDADYLSLTAGFIGTSLAIFYGHFYLLTRYPAKKNRRQYLLGLGGVMLAGPLFFLPAHQEKLIDALETLKVYGMAFTTILPLFLGLSWLARITENLVLNTVRKEQFEKQAAQAELAYLKAQINPHFLFNTLHNIHTLVYKQAATASEAVLGLASLMRYMIYESNANLVPLTREMEYLQDYISLQQLRYKAPNVVALECSGATAGWAVAPLLFIHLLENAFKHSPARLDTGDIQVNIQVTGETLTFQVKNPLIKRPTGTEELPGGIGLANVRKRLALLYPDQHDLEIIRSEGSFKVMLKIEGLKRVAHEKNTDLPDHR